MKSAPNKITTIQIFVRRTCNYGSVFIRLYLEISVFIPFCLWPMVDKNGKSPYKSPYSSNERRKPVYGLLQRVRDKVRVYLCSKDVFVSQQLAYSIQIHTVLDQVRGVSMA